MEELDQLQKEWVFINATRELLSMIGGVSGTRYSQAISFAKLINPKLFKGSKSGIDKKDYFEKLYLKYKQEAIAKQRKSKKKVTADKLIRNRYREIRRLLKQFKNEDKRFNLLKKDASDLEVLIEQSTYFNFNGIERLTEGQAISYDTNNNRVDKLFIENHLGKFSLYINKKNNSVFRITVLHPNPAEAVIGADLIYEQYDETKKKVRIVAIQYKIWENYVLYFSKAGNLGDQIDKMKKCFCGKKYCADNKGNKNSSAKYRLSYCMAFLKPTDKLQDPKKPITSGYHVPICKINSLKEKANKDYMLTGNGIKNQSIKTSSFEELFDSEMLGSRWLDIKQLEKFYQKNKVLEPTERIILYAQGTKSFE